MATTKLSPTTAVIDCNCRHEYQDQQFGTGRRFANLAGGTAKDGAKWRCTVCEREVAATRAEIKASSEEND